MHHFSHVHQKKAKKMTSIELSSSNIFFLPS